MRPRRTESRVSDPSCRFAVRRVCLIILVDHVAGHPDDPLLAVEAESDLGPLFAVIDILDDASEALEERIPDPHPVVLLEHGEGAHHAVLAVQFHREFIVRMREGVPAAVRRKPADDAVNAGEHGVVGQRFVHVDKDVAGEQVVAVLLDPALFALTRDDLRRDGAVRALLFQQIRDDAAALRTAEQAVDIHGHALKMRELRRAEPNRLRMAHQAVFGAPGLPHTTASPSVTCLVRAGDHRSSARRRASRAHKQHTKKLRPHHYITGTAE